MAYGTQRVRTRVPSKDPGSAPNLTAQKVAVNTGSARPKDRATAQNRAAISHHACPPHPARGPLPRTGLPPFGEVAAHMFLTGYGVAFAASRLGGTPNLRAYSRLNWLGLS